MCVCGLFTYKASAVLSSLLALQGLKILLVWLLPFVIVKTHVAPHNSPTVPILFFVCMLMCVLLNYCYCELLERPVAGHLLCIQKIKLEVVKWQVIEKTLARDPGEPVPGKIPAFPG